MAADNFVRGYLFDGVTGLKTGANLEDLVTLARFTAAAFAGDADSLFDGDTIVRDANGNAKVGDGSIDTAHLADDAVTTDKIEDGAVTTAKVAAGVGSLIGELKIWTTSILPSGYLEANGAAVSRATYSDLFDVYNADSLPHGEGDGATTFNLPDMRGRFPRGWAHGSSRDPDRATRTANASGGAIGDNVGSVQADQLKSHSHRMEKGTGNNESGRMNDAAGNHQNWAGGPTEATGGNETRPENTNVMYIVKT